MACPIAVEGRTGDRFVLIGCKSGVGRHTPVVHGVEGGAISLAVGMAHLTSGQVQPTTAVLVAHMCQVAVTIETLSLVHGTPLAARLQAGVAEIAALQ